MTDLKEKTYTIVTAAKAANLGETYIRNLIRAGKLQTTRVPIREGAEVFKHVITETELNRFLTRDRRHTGTRADGRNKFVVHMSSVELEQVKSLIAGAGLDIEFERAYTPEMAAKMKAVRVAKLEKARIAAMAAKAATPGALPAPDKKTLKSK